MRPPPYSVFKAVQGLSFPRKSELYVIEEWDTNDWECTQKVVNELSTTTEIVIIPPHHPNAETIIEKSKHADYKFTILIYAHREQDIIEDFNELNPFIIKTRGSFLGIVLHKDAKQSFLGNKILSGSKIDLNDPNFFLPDFDRSNWDQKGNKIILKTTHMDVEFLVPEMFSLKRTSPDLLWAIEHVLLSPWNDIYNNKWVPTRRPGSRAGLSYSGGIDSTAAMCLMPTDTILFYLERNFESMIHHENAHRILSHLEKEGRHVVSIQSNHEKIRTFHDKNAGFSTDYACMAHMILVADYFDLDAAGTGMPLENTYFYHGSKIRDFKESGFWKRYEPIFSYLGIPIYQPVAGCSEIVNNTIVNKSGYKGLATSCLRSTIPGKTCDSCWKCFRKNIFNELKWQMSPEISTFLTKRPLKQGIATLLALQILHKMNHQIPEEVQDLIPLMSKDLGFLNKYWGQSIDLLPSKYQEITKERLSRLIPEMDIDLYSLDSEITTLLQGGST